MRRTIIITDPCYIGKYSAYVKEDDWDDNDFGDIHFLVNRFNLFGDWHCMCYRGDVDYEKLSEEWNIASSKLRKNVRIFGGGRYD